MPVERLLLSLSSAEVNLLVCSLRVMSMVGTLGGRAGGMEAHAKHAETLSNVLSKLLKDEFGKESIGPEAYKRQLAAEEECG